MNRNRSTHLTALMIVFALAAASLSAQVAAPVEEPLTAQIDAMFAEAYPDADGPGAAMLVVDDGEVVYRSARGMANVELGVSLSADHVFRLGSITKQFTAAAVLLLEEQGKLSVDEPITEYLPDFPTHGHTITIEHLLTHTSGIFNYTNVPGFMDQEVRRDVTTDELVASFHEFEMDFEPGERWNYSNSGYVLLGAIIEKVTGKSYAEFVREAIFEPIGMRKSYYGGPQIIPDRAAGYALDGDGYANAPFISMSQPHAAGSLLSTVDDLATWQRALESGELISPESFDRMTTRGTLNDGTTYDYGYGFSVSTLRGHPVVQHGGGIHGFSTFAMRIPDEDVYIAVLSNIPGGGPGPGPLALRVGALVVGDPFPEYERIQVAPEVLERYVGVYSIADGTKRTVTLEDGKLFTQRGGGAKLEAIPHSETGFFYEQSMTHFEIVLTEQGEVSHMLMYHDGADTAERADMTDEALAAAPQEVAVDPSIYDNYVGRYELAPGFVLTVSRDGDQLFTQATGQMQVEVFPSSETDFFLKVVDAQLTFEVGDDGRAVAVTLHQAGQHIRGERLEE